MADTKQHRERANKLGIEWSVVVETYRELRTMQKLDREPDWEIRQQVWDCYASSSEHARWWRYGMERKFSRAFGEGDRTSIPRFDEVADMMADSHGQFQTNDPAETLFEYLKTEWVRVPSADDTYDEAIRLCVNETETLELVVSDSDDTF